MAPIAVPRVSEMLVTEAVSAATGSSMVMETLIDAVPPELLAQMVNVVEVMFTVGVPLMVHVPWLSVNPFGRPGDMLHVAPLTLVRAIGAELCPWTVA